MAKPKYIYQLGTGRRYVYSERLAMRKDMVTYDPAKKAKDMPPAKEVQAPDSFLKRLMGSNSRRQVQTLVKNELGEDLEMQRRVADMKKAAKDLFKARSMLKKKAARDDGAAQKATDFENSTDKKVQESKAAALRAHIEAEKKAKAKSKAEEDSKDVKTDETGSTEK
jgi:hypothetical protein